MSETIYTMSDVEYLKYLYKVEKDKILVNHLLFEDKFYYSKEIILSELCEYYSTLTHMKNMLDDINECYFDKEKNDFYLNDELALNFTALMEVAVFLKEQLLKDNISLSSH